jgi:hypothetical protein
MVCNLTVPIKIVYYSFLQSPMHLLYTILDQAYTNSRCQVAWETDFCMMVPSPCGFSVKNLLHGTFLALRSWRQLLECWTIFGPLFRNTTLTKKLSKCKHSLPLISICTAKCNEHLFTGFRNRIFEQTDKWLLLPLLALRVKNTP